MSGCTTARRAATWNTGWKPWYQALHRAAVPACAPQRLLKSPSGWAAPRIILSCLCGHTHVPRLMQWGSVLIVNPGSVGPPAYAGDHPNPHVIENGTPHARYAMLEKTRQGWQVDLRAVPYDHLAQAAVASRQGRDDWAHALATGSIKRSP